jgi:hypothetical protein
MDYLAHGWSPDEMCRQHPYLQPVEAHAAMAYYFDHLGEIDFDHQGEIDREIRSEWQEVQQDRSQSAPSPFFLRLKARGLL